MLTFLEENNTLYEVINFRIYLTIFLRRYIMKLKKSKARKLRAVEGGEQDIKIRLARYLRPSELNDLLTTKYIMGVMPRLKLSITQITNPAEVFFDVEFSVPKSFLNVFIAEIIKDFTRQIEINRQLKDQMTTMLIEKEE